MRISLLFLVVLPVATRAAEDLSVLSGTKGDTPPRKMLHAYLIAECQKQFDARREAVAAIKSADDLTKRNQRLRQKFIEALGGFLEKTDLKPRVVGKLERDGYTIEKVIYESRPNHHVTANFYLPAAKGPFPGVLMPIGHSNNGKAADYIQRGAILLAKHGMAVLTYDPIGQGERKQLLDEKGKAFIPASTNEHTLAGVGALLVGRSTASYRVWDGIRSLDYLTSRPEIDPKRIGCTGCSGGGTMTSYLMALDDRILAAAPSCYVTSLERLFATIGPQDAEQNVTGQVAYGMDHADYILMRAPKPTLLCAATKDFFDIQGTWTTFREAKRVYTMLGAPEKIDLVETDTTHGFPRGQREAMLRFMARWLLHKDQPLVEEEAKPEKEADLLCTRTGQVLEDLKGKSVFDLNAERARELAKHRESRPIIREELLQDVTRTIGLSPSIVAATAKAGDTVSRDGYQITKVIFETEPTIRVPALRIEPESKRGGPWVVYLHGHGKSADAGPGGPIEKLVKAGNRVLALDPRGIGETAPGTPPTKPTYFGVDFKESFLGLHLNRPLLGQRVYDVLSVIKYLANESGEEISIIGFGSAAPIALHAAALCPNVKQVTVERGLISWANVAATPVSYDQLTHAVPNALAVYDLPELGALIAPRGLTVRGPVDAAGKPVPPTTVEATYARTKAAYAKLKQEKKLTIAGE